jgi:nitroreductase
MAPDIPVPLQSLLSRRSIPALQLGEPGPTQAEIERAVDAALSAPDHGALRPLRLVLVRGAARQQLSDLFVRRMQQRDAGIPPGKIDKARRMPLAAPLVIAVGARILPQHKVPELEQLLAAGAGVMNLLNAFHAQGYGAIWLTGGNAYDAQVLQALNFAADERGLGFVYVGSIGSPMSAPPRRLERDGAVRDWGS